MSNIHPLVSVIIPVYNGGTFLRHAVRSIQKQSYQRIETIIIDDGSTDETAEIAKSFSPDIRYVYQPNKGLPAARNRGLSEASGDLIASLDADDLWTEDKLNMQVELLSQDPSMEIVLGRTQKTQLHRYENGVMRFQTCSEPAVAMSLGAALIRKSVFDKVGKISNDLPYCCDWDWFMRARELEVSILVHPEIVQYYQRHDSNMTEQIIEGNHYTLVMLKESLKRRRQHHAGIAKSLPELSQFEVSPNCQNIQTPLPKGR